MKTAIMFSGQGSQYPGMMRDVFENYGVTKKVFEQAKELLGRDIYALTMNGTQDELNFTPNTQPCLLACELAVFQVLQDLGIEYGAAVGFSLGEWAAAVAVGAAEEKDIIPIVQQRAAAMQDAVPEGKGGMAVVLGQEDRFVRDLCRLIGNVAPANYNCPGNITVAGTATAIESFLSEAEKQGIMASRVAVSVPSHCELMRPAAEKLTPIIREIPLRAPQAEFIMNAIGRPVQNCDEIRENMIKQLCQPVLFQQSLEYLLNAEYDTFVEIGPGKALSGMVKRTAKQLKKPVKILQFNSLSTIQETQKLLAQA